MKSLIRFTSSIVLAASVFTLAACGAQDQSGEASPAGHHPTGSVQQAVLGCTITLHDNVGNSLTLTQTTQPQEWDLSTYCRVYSHGTCIGHWNGQVKYFTVTGGCAGHFGNNSTVQTCGTTNDCTDFNTLYNNPYSENPATLCDQSKQYVTLSDVCKP